MHVNIIAFGQIADITGSELTLDVHDTGSLVEMLNEQFPELHKKKFTIAVNRQVVTVNTPLTHNDTVALMPPFSGG